jgi:hypothetical protein
VTYLGGKFQFSSADTLALGRTKSMLAWRSIDADQLRSGGPSKIRARIDLRDTGVGSFNLSCLGFI